MCDLKNSFVTPNEMHPRENDAVLYKVMYNLKKVVALLNSGPLNF